MGKTYVTATVIAKDGAEQELEAILAKLVEEVRKEEGCIRYDLHRSDYGNVFLFYEIWQSPAHLAAHGKTPHMAAMAEAIKNLVAGPAEVNTWEEIDVSGS